LEFVKVARISDLPGHRGKLVRVGDEEIALWRVNGKVYAISNVCPHQHFSMLHQGALEGIHVTCPMHGWTFSLEDGNPSSGNGRAKTYQVRVVGEDVFVERPKNKW
jgi:NAD(P)H-dependent nitrite reductase small subunit